MFSKRGGISIIKRKKDVQQEIGQDRIEIAVISSLSNSPAPEQTNVGTKKKDIKNVEEDGNSTNTNTNNNATKKI